MALLAIYSAFTLFFGSMVASQSPQPKFVMAIWILITVDQGLLSFGLFGSAFLGFSLLVALSVSMLSLRKRFFEENPDWES